MEGAKSYIEIILFFLKKNHLGQIGYFRPKKWWVPITLDPLKDFFFEILDHFEPENDPPSKL